MRSAAVRGIAATVPPGNGRAADVNTPCAATRSERLADLTETLAFARTHLASVPANGGPRPLLGDFVTARIRASMAVVANMNSIGDYIMAAARAGEDLPASARRSGRGLQPVPSQIERGLRKPSAEYPAADRQGAAHLGRGAVRAGRGYPRIRPGDSGVRSAPPQRPHDSGSGRSRSSSSRWTSPSRWRAQKPPTAEVVADYR